MIDRRIGGGSLAEPHLLVRRTRLGVALLFVLACALLGSSLPAQAAPNGPVTSAAPAEPAPTAATPASEPAATGNASARRAARLAAKQLSAERRQARSQAKAVREKPQNASGEGLFYERVSYGPRYGQRQDIWASATPNSPLIVLVHGGGWRQQGALTYLKRQALALQAHGFSVFSINYKQTTPSRPAFPYEPEDVVLATQWAIAHASNYNANPANVIVLGGSAGGNLAALAAEQLDAAKAGTVKAVISLSGPMNFETLVPMVENGQIANASFVTSIYRALGGDEEEGFFGEGEEGEAEETLALMREGSPALNIPRAQNCPNWLLFTSEHDLVPASQSQEMVSLLARAGCKASLQVLPGDQHAFAYWNQASESVFSFVKAQ